MDYAATVQEMSENIVRDMHKAQKPFIEKVMELCSEYQGKPVTEAEMQEHGRRHTYSKDDWQNGTTYIEVFFYKSVKMGTFTTTLKNDGELTFTTWHPQKNTEH